MAIADLKLEGKIRKGPPCTVCHMLKTLSLEDTSALLRLLSDVSVPYSVLSDGLRGEGHDVAASTLARHARGICEARTKLR